MSNPKRTFITVTGFTIKEVEKIKAMSQKDGLSMAAYIRKVFINATKLR